MMKHYHYVRLFRKEISEIFFSDKLEPLRDGPFKIFIKPTEVTFKFLKQDEKTFHTNRNHLRSY